MVAGGETEAGAAGVGADSGQAAGSSSDGVVASDTQALTAAGWAAPPAGSSPTPHNAQGQNQDA